MVWVQTMRWWGKTTRSGVAVKGSATRADGGSAVHTRWEEPQAAACRVIRGLVPRSSDIEGQLRLGKRTAARCPPDPHRPVAVGRAGLPRFARHHAERGPPRGRRRALRPRRGPVTGLHAEPGVPAHRPLPLGTRDHGDGGAGPRGHRDARDDAQQARLAHGEHRQAALPSARQPGPQVGAPLVRVRRAAAVRRARCLRGRLPRVGPVRGSGRGRPRVHRAAPGCGAVPGADGRRPGCHASRRRAQGGLRRAPRVPRRRVTDPQRLGRHQRLGSPGAPAPRTAVLLRRHLLRPAPTVLRAASLPRHVRPGRPAAAAAG